MVIKTAKKPLAAKDKTADATPRGKEGSSPTLEDLQKQRADIDRMLLEKNPNKGDFFNIQRPLIAAISDYMITHGKNTNGMTIDAFSRVSGISKGNIGSILRGQRWAARCERDVIDALAKTLRVPVLQIYMLSGFITAEDTVFNIDMDQTLEAIYLKMSKDNMVVGRVPSRIEWDELPRSIKLSFCQMYEIAVQKVLLRMATARMNDDVKLVAQS